MDQLVNMKRVKKTAYALSASFFFIHFLLYEFFTLFNVTPMAHFNIFSVTFYLLSLLLIRGEMLSLYTVLVYLEVITHMVLAVYYVGWDSGFQINLIAVNIMLFYKEYIFRSLSLKYIPSLPLSFLGICSYLGVCIVSHYHPPAYPLPTEISFRLQVAWGLTTFLMTTYFLQNFVLMTFASEHFLSKLVMRDKLTGLPNRYYMSEQLNGVDQAHHPESYWAAMVDIDNFKSINDTYGHNCGDYVLKTLAGILRSNGAQTKLCRWGGEEFLLVGHGAPDAQELLEGLRKAVEDYRFVYQSQEIRLTITVGMARWEPGITVTEWIDLADKKLYQGKCNGKNQVVV